MDFLVANKQAQIERMGEGENRERAKWERKKRGSEDMVEERKARVERDFVSILIYSFSVSKRKKRKVIFKI